MVFLAGCGKKFNRQDARGRILIDEELGIAADFFDPEKKVKAPTLKKNVLARRSNLENMGEELRILYVAMTRAKEKLILTGTVPHAADKLEACLLEQENSKKKLWTLQNLHMQRLIMTGSFRQQCVKQKKFRSN